MKTKDYLNQISRFESMIRRKKDEVSRLDIMICGIPANEMNPDKVQSSMVGDKMSSAVAKIVDSQREIEGLMELYLIKRKYIISQIDAMPDQKAYEVLTDHYVQRLSLSEIARNYDCTESNVKKSLSVALKKFEEMYGEEYLDNPTVFS